MKSSIWVLNSLLLLLFIFIGVFFAFFQPTLSPRKSLSLKKTDAAPSKKALIVNTKRIYENDLFGTYKSALPEKPAVASIPQIPSAPEAPPLVHAPVASPEFLEPLNLRLTGIFTESDESKSRAILIDTKTNIQKSYKIGEMIGDAELLRIFENSVLFVRSNGQEETLFITRQVALESSEFNNDQLWDGVIEKEDETNYYIDSENFLSRIQNLSQFLEAIDATTVYKKGKAFGIRIGKIATSSVGYALGLKPGDIITSINSIATITTQERVQIYTLIKQMKLKDSCSIDILRHGEELRHSYTLKSLVKKTFRPIAQKFEEKIVPVQQPDAVTIETLDDQKRSLTESKNGFASRIHTIHKKDKQAMMHRGSFKKYA